MMKNKKDWFEEWFNSEQYHLLYRNRNQEEARKFILALSAYLNPQPSAKILDLACGKGRHAIQLNRLGFQVKGIDLSKESIAHAKQFENAQLSFDCGDMRELPYVNEFDFIFNLFTSFGYFETEKENLKVIQSIANALKKNGILVLDYLNVHKVSQLLPIKEQVTREGISFRIEKYLTEDYIVKEIHCQDGGKSKSFKEKVRKIDKAKFEEFFKSANLKPKAVFGDYHLNPFEEASSDRLIMIVKK